MVVRRRFRRRSGSRRDRSAALSGGRPGRRRRTRSHLARCCSRVDQDVVADQRGLDRGMRADIAVAADPDVGADHPQPNRPPFRAPISTFAPITARGSTITPSSRCAVGSITAEGAMAACRTRIAGAGGPEKLAGDGDEFAERLRRVQHRDMGRNTGLEARADQARSGGGRASWSAYFRLSKKARCIGPASSSEASPLTCWPPGRNRPAPLWSTRQVSAGVEMAVAWKMSVRHSTRRGPAGDRTRAPVLIDHNRAVSA